MSTAFKITYMKNTGSIIKERRKSLNLTQKDVGKAAGVSPVTVGYWEKNQHKPSGEHLLGLARILKLRPEDLVGPLKTPKVSDIERQADTIRQAYLESSEEMRAVIDRILGDVREIDSREPTNKP